MQIGRQNRGRNTERSIATADGIDARCGQQQFTGVDKVLIASITVEAMPALAGHEIEKTLLMGHVLGGMILPKPAIHAVRHERPDEAALRQQKLAGFNTQFDAVHPHPAAAGPFVDLGVDLKGRE